MLVSRFESLEIRSYHPGIHGCIVKLTLPGAPLNVEPVCFLCESCTIDYTHCLQCTNEKGKAFSLTPRFFLKKKPLY